MTSLRKRYLMGLLLLLLGGLATYAWNALPDGPRWQQGYQQIVVGDSEERVLEVMGKPSEIKDCHRPSYSGNPELWYKCAEEHWYVVVMERWIIVIGKDGRVAAKWHNVSP